MRDWTIGILGYGNQGRAQALNLRDAGYSVRIGARAGGPSAGAALDSGFIVEAPTDLGASCELIAVLTPDHTHPALLAVLADAARVKAVVLAHGFALRFLQPRLSPGWDVLLVAPSGPGASLRTQGGAGRIPALLAVHQDVSGSAWDLARSYAVAAGCSGDALLRTTVAEEAEIDLFGEQAVLCGGLVALLQAAWETLVKEGYDPSIAYMECIHQIGLTSNLITRFGVTGMRERISPLALFGDLTRGRRLIDGTVRERMAEILSEVRGGRFAMEFTREAESGFPQSRRGLELSASHPLETAGEKVRRMGADRPLPEPS